MVFGDFSQKQNTRLIQFFFHWLIALLGHILMVGRRSFNNLFFCKKLKCNDDGDDQMKIHMQSIQRLVSSCSLTHHTLGFCTQRPILLAPPALFSILILWYSAMIHSSYNNLTSIYRRLKPNIPKFTTDGVFPAVLFCKGSEYNP